MLKYVILVFTLLSGRLCQGQETWEWARSIAGHIDMEKQDRSVEDMSSAIATDHEGNVYLVGLFSDSIVQEGFRLFTAPRTQSSTPIDIFVAKFNSTGKLLWLRSFDGNFVTCATVDSKNNLYIGGSFGPFMTVGDIDVPGNGGYIIKCSPEGAFEWVRTCRAESGSTKVLGLSAIGDDIFFTGRGLGGNSIQFGDITSNTSSFIGKVTSDGTTSWFRSNGYSGYFLMGVAALSDGGCFASSGYEIFRYSGSGEVIDTLQATGAFNTIASDGKTICGIGQFRGTITAGDLTMEASSNNMTMFLAVYSLDGEALQLRIGVGNGSNPYGICVDSIGSYYVTGRYGPTIAFDELSVGSGRFGSSFVLRLDSTFHASYLYAPPDPDNDCFLNTLASTKNNETYAAGFYRDTVAFGEHKASVISTYFPDVVIAKLGFTSAVHEAKAPLDDFSLFPVPASGVLHINMEAASNISIVVYDLFGREVLRSTETTLDVSSLPSGIYRLLLQNGNSVRSRTFQIVR